MKGTRRFPRRLVRWTSLCVCLALLLSVSTFPIQDTSARTKSRFQLARVNDSNGSELNAFASFIALLFPQAGVPPSVPGPNLPDLDAARAIQAQDPQAPAASSEICEDCEPCPTCNLNHAPVAITGGPYNGFATQAIHFDGNGSFDPDGDSITFQWNFGDGSSGSGPAPTHVYAAQGTYTVMLSVTDTHNASGSATTSATVAPPPTPMPTPTPTPTPSPSTNSARFISQSVPTNMSAGSTYPVSVTMRNTGGTTWTAAHLYRLGSQSPQDNSNWGMARVYLTNDIAPGAEVTFNFTVVAPPGVQCGGRGRNGTHYGFQWRMVQDSVEWFGDPSAATDVRSCGNMLPIQTYTPNDHYSARLEPRNRTGSGGDDLFSRNFNWAINLLSMAGRSGLNLNLSLSYNSLVWTRVNSAFIFDADRGFPGPGFRLGFPTIQGPFTNAQAGTHSYLLITPSGSRIELRQTGTSLYASVDSSNLRLVDSGGDGLLLTDDSGTQMTYLLTNGEYHCTSIKDRNGNFIIARYDPTKETDNFGLITSIVDTLGRTIKFNYDGRYHLQSITQEWSGGTHVWATFSYGDLEVRPNFSAGDVAPSISGLPGKDVLSVLTQVGLDDGSHYNFDYNSWGQVYEIHQYAADDHELNRITYNLPLDGYYPQTDCPRFTERRDWAESWNNDSEAATSYSYNPETITSNGLSWDNLQWSQVVVPDGTKYREYSTAVYDDWFRGLVTRTETYSADNAVTARKTTVTDWSQDLINVGYQLNPRVAAITISDSDGNRRRMTIEYATFGLPFDVFEWGPYGTQGWTLLRRSHTDYELSDVYLFHRIIGLPRQQFLFSNEDNAQKLYRKLTYEYDAGGTFLQSQGPPIQHDETNYGGGFVQGRGNVTGIRRWDANHETEIGYTITSTAGYNTAGSVIFSSDELNHQTTINYVDSFSDNINRNTFAHPTQITINDPTPISSSIQYNYDTGAKTRVQGPPPSGQSQGVIQTYAYDSAQRLTRATTVNTGAYTRFVYPPSQTIVNRFTTINDLSTETYSAKILDGAGRLRATASEFPNSTGHYSGQYMLFDVMGRAIQQTNPTEMTHNWAAAGDDVAGWYSSSQTYDWKGRPLVTTNQDGTTKEASYGGCGCAGGAMVTLKDEGAMIDGVLKRRTQRIYSDALSGAVKTEVLNWDGSIYSTTSNAYNARDQVMLVRQWEGAESAGGVYQDTTMSYDGYGRLKTKHVPEQQVDPNNSSSTDHTTYNYNPDDTVSSVIDARGASATFTYNNRHLVTAISYSAPSGITLTSNVSFSYDAAANRTSMSDGTGSTTYGFDQLSRLTSETRRFNGLAAIYTLTYAYNLAGELISITDPFGAQVGYNHDQTGQTTEVTGSGYSNVSTYASNIRWRAWGAMKHLTYGNGRALDTAYDARLQVITFNVPGIMGSQYQYNNDGRVRFAQDLARANSPFDRSYSYDHAARLIEAKTGSQARGGSVDDGPYYETYGFSAFGKLVSRSGTNWAQPINGFSATYTNNRRQDWTYDASGWPTQQDTLQTSYDAAGHRVRTFDSAVRGRFHSGLTITQNYDGNGARVRHQQNTSNPTYFLRSSALGGAVIDELVPVGSVVVKTKGYVYAAGQLLATQEVNEVRWAHFDPRTENGWQSNPAGASWGVAQVDPFGADAGFTPPPEDPGPPSGESDLLYPKYADIFNGSTGCTIDGAMASCDQVADMNPDSYTDLPPGISTIQIVIDRDTGDLGIRDTDFVINSETGDVYKRKWVDTSGTRPAPEQLPNGGVAVDDGDTIVTRGYIPSGHWEYTKVNFGSSKNPGSTQPQTNARNLLGDCAVHALLDTLSYSEGADYNTVVNGTVISAPNNPGLVGQRNVKVTDFSQHPNILVQVGPGLKSTAAGRYQFLNRTWNGLGLPSFNPFNQDIGAVMLMQRRGMITPLLNGDVQTAITNGNAEWASLPGSPYGQGTRSMNSLKNVYNRSFLNCVLQMHEIHQGQLDNSGA